MMAEPAAALGRPYDVVVIGGGVVGSAVFREFVLAGLHTVLLEQDADLLNGASKGNSGLLHTGFDATPGSLEVRCMQEGYRRYQEVRAGLNLPFEPTGAIVVAWTQAQHDMLPQIVAQAHANGVTDVRLASAEEVLAREAKLNPAVFGGVLIPGEGMIDPWSAPLAYVLQGLANGGTVRRGFAVGGGTFASGAWQLVAPAGSISARVVINCAGNYGDLGEAIARPSPFRIRPRKGQFVVFDKTAHELARSILLPVPTARTKGVVVSRTIFGNLIVGPTAEDQDERRHASVDETVLRGLIEEGQRILPGLAQEPVTAVYAGLRPATEFKDYQIEALPQQGWISVSGIRSTGLTASLGIAAYVRGLFESHFFASAPLSDPVLTPVPNLSQTGSRPYQDAGHSALVCQCELVTRREIEAAFEGALPVATLGGLKRRTRCTMGRCQGFYCLRQVSEIAAGRASGLPSAPRVQA